MSRPAGFHDTEETRRKKSEANTGKLNKWWKGGKHKTSHGYIAIWLSPNDFFRSMAQKSGYVLEHRLVMAKHLNRCLLNWEVIHHKNSIRGDNRMENLELFPTPYKHSIITKMGQRIKGLEAEIERLTRRLKNE